ncbi:MAG TPA: hypothetical protein VJC16_00525, partial [Candidatus Nanoarchaeia archaeon]|nr:hypothetical protein [Candidatus Nanoarchaeia archaeon]
MKIERFINILCSLLPIGGFMYKTKEERLSPEFINGELRSLLGLSFPEYVPPQGSPEIPLEGEVYAHRWKDRATGERKRTWHGPGTAAYLRAIRVDHALRRGYQEVFSGDPSLKYGRRQHFTPDQIAAL